MKKYLFVCSTLLAAMLASPVASLAQAKPKDAKTAPAATAAPAATDAQIADAKAKGMVWVNTNSKVYHKDGEFYGKTKQGKFMTEDDAKKAGFHAAKSEGLPKKSKKS